MLRARRLRAFTLLEVLVAVAILALSMTALFSSQVGAIGVAIRARKVTVASMLARCKMGEIEEQLLDEGLPGTALSGRDECCEDGEVEGYTCEWAVELVQLPEEGFADDEDDSEPVGLDSVLAGGGESDGMAQLAMQYAYPTLRPAIEQQVRLAKIEVKWEEGDRERSIDLAQYVVGQPVVPEGLEEEE